MDSDDSMQSAVAKLDSAVEVIRAAQAVTLEPEAQEGGVVDMPVDAAAAGKAERVEPGGSQR